MMMTSQRCRSFRAVCFAAVMLLGIGSASSARATTKTYQVPTDGSVEIHLASWLENAPPTGMISVTVTVKNNTTEPGVWRIQAVDQSYGSGSMQSSFAVSAGAGAETRTSLLVPMLPNYETASSYTYKNVRLSVSGPGVGLGAPMVISARSAPSSSSSLARTPFTVVSEGFETYFHSSWETGIRKAWNGDTVEMADAPVDWRAYSGIAQFWLFDQEWPKLSVPQRDALLAWVAHGGTALIATVKGASSVELPEGSGEWKQGVLQHGLGELQMVATNVLGTQASKLIQSNNALSMERAMDGSLSETDSLGALVPQLEMNGMLIFLFIVVFGVVVGPVNLFWLAKGSRRPRLFWTTPLISCAGTAVLIAVMVLQDGFGGTGARVTLAVVLPSQKQMTLVQEQTSKTGILLGSAFELPKAEAAWASPIPQATQDDEGRYGRRAIRMTNKGYAAEGATQTGGWFSSRSRQTQWVASQRLNRGSVEVGGDNAPYVISSLNTPLRTFYYQDHQQRVWKADAVPVGQKTPLKAAPTGELAQWKATAVKTKMGPLMRAHIDRCLPLPEGWFFAEVAEPTKLAAPTLGSIEWSKDRAFVSGLCVPAAVTAAR